MQRARDRVVTGRALFAELADTPVSALATATGHVRAWAHTGAEDVKRHCAIAIGVIALCGCSLFSMRLRPADGPTNAPEPVRQYAPQQAAPTWLVELGAAAGAAVMVIGHRYWYHRRAKG